MSSITKRLLVVVFGLIFAVALPACAGEVTVTPPTQPPVPTQAPVEPQPTTAPTGAATAAEPTQPAAQASPTPVPFTAQIKGHAVNPEQSILMPRVDDPNQQAKLFTSGLHVVPPGVPVYLEADSTGLAEGAEMATFAWEVTGPEGSTAQISEVPQNEETEIGPGVASFTPDALGTYTVRLTVTDNQGNASVPAEFPVVVAKYVGQANCQGCHADQHAQWSETGHASFFTRMVNGQDFAPEEIEEYKTAGFGCARCHTVGYYNITDQSTGGWWDMAVNVLKFDWPEERIGTPGTFESFPPELQALSNIQCENCHGPGGSHNGDPTKIATSMDSGTCDQCHNDGHFHTRGEQLENSAHIHNAELTAANGRAECARCHSPEGFVDFIDGVETEEQRNQVGEIACAVCHDPHDETNPFMLRLVGEVRGAPIEITDAGKSAVCQTCHNARNTAESIVTDKPEFPHYSAAAEALAGEGGYDFGVDIPDSNHGVVGQQPSDDGQKPGTCVGCHMFTTPGGPENATRTEPEQEITDETNPGHNMIGSHTFTMTATRPNGEQVELIEACQGCHQGITTFNFPATADYDGNGQVQGVQDEVRGLLDTLRGAIEANGAQALEGYPYFKLPENASTELVASIYNYRFVIGVIPQGEGRAATIHNFKRSVALLQLSYNRLTGEDIQNAVLLYK